MSPEYRAETPTDATDRATGGTASDRHTVTPDHAGQGASGHEYGAERLPVTPGSSRPERRGRGPGLHGLRDVLGQLSGRDLAVLDLVAEHRFLSTGHVERFCFYDHASPDSGARSCRRVLTRLERDRLLERVPRRIGGLRSGSSSSVWMLTSTGQRLRNLRSGSGAVGKIRAPGSAFIAHYLGIADVRLTLTEAARSGHLVVTQVQIEPRAWRPFTGRGGAREILKPDLFAVTAQSVDAEFEDHWFIEVDRGTESIPTLLRQCRVYETYRRTGLEQKRAEVFPRVLWVVPDERRADKLTSALATAQGLDRTLFVVTPAERVLTAVHSTDGGGS